MIIYLYFFSKRRIFNIEGDSIKTLDETKELNDYIKSISAICRKEIKNLEFYDETDELKDNTVKMTYNKKQKNSLIKKYWEIEDGIASLNVDYEKTCLPESLINDLQKIGYLIPETKKKISIITNSVIKKNNSIRKKKIKDSCKKIKKLIQSSDIFKEGKIKNYSKKSYLSINEFMERLMTNTLKNSQNDFIQFNFNKEVVLEEQEKLKEAKEMVDNYFSFSLTSDSSISRYFKSFNEHYNVISIYINKRGVLDILTDAIYEIKPYKTEYKPLNQYLNTLQKYINKKAKKSQKSFGDFNPEFLQQKMLDFLNEKGKKV